MTTNVVFVISLVLVRLIAHKALMTRHRTQTLSLLLLLHHLHHLIHLSLVILMMMAVTLILNLCQILGRRGRTLKIYVTILTTTSMKTILGPCTRSIARLTSSLRNSSSFIKQPTRLVFLTSDYKPFIISRLSQLISYFFPINIFLPTH